MIFAIKINLSCQHVFLHFGRVLWQLGQFLTVSMNVTNTSWDMLLEVI